MKNKKGMSLIVLVITIIVMIILAGVTVMGLSSNSPIAKANEATFKSNAKNYASELQTSLVTGLAQTGTTSYFDAEGEDVKLYVPTITDKDLTDFEIQDGEVAYKGTTKLKSDWVKSIGLLDANPPINTNEITPIAENTGETYLASFVQLKSGAVVGLSKANNAEGVAVYRATKISASGNVENRIEVPMPTANNYYIKSIIELSNGNIAMLYAQQGYATGYVAIYDSTLNTCVNTIIVNYSGSQAASLIAEVNSKLVICADAYSARRARLDVYDMDGNNILANYLISANGANLEPKYLVSYGNSAYLVGHVGGYT